MEGFQFDNKILGEVYQELAGNPLSDKQADLGKTLIDELSKAGSNKAPKSKDDIYCRVALGILLHSKIIAQGLSSVDFKYGFSLLASLSSSTLKNPGICSLIFKRVFLEKKLRDSKVEMITDSNLGNLDKNMQSLAKGDFVTHKCYISRIRQNRG